MRVEQNVWDHPAFGKGHVLRWPQSAQDALLTMTAGKLVSDGWIPRDSHCDANTLEFPTAGVITAHFDVIHNTIFFTPRKN